MNLETLVNCHYDKLNDNDRIIIKQILIFQTEYQNLSSEEIAGKCHVSRATLLRLCRKIGLSSFSDLKYLLKEKTVTPVGEIDNFHSICENYYLLLNELKKISFSPICKTLYNAQTIYVYGTGNEQKNLAQELKRVFLSVGKCVIDLFDEGEAAFLRNTFLPSDVFIIISLSGETTEAIELIKRIQGHIQTLSITRLENNTISTLCDQNLYVATQRLNELEESTYELVGVFYTLIDLLFMNYLEYARRV